MNKTCKTCGIELDVNRLKKDRRLLCKDCNNSRILKFVNNQNNKRAKSNKYYMYYLPEEHYIGITNYPKNRKAQHSSKGKITEGMEIVAEYNNPKLLVLHEALMHYIGYNGSAYDKMLKSKIK